MFFCPFLFLKKIPKLSSSVSLDSFQFVCHFLFFKKNPKLSSSVSLISFLFVYAFLSIYLFSMTVSARLSPHFHSISACFASSSLYACHTVSPSLHISACFIFCVSILHISLQISLSVPIHLYIFLRISL